MYIIEQIYNFKNTYDTLEEAETYIKNNPISPGEKVVIAEVVKAYSVDPLPTVEINIKEMRAEKLALESK